MKQSVPVKDARGVLEKVGGLPLHAYAREDWDQGVRLEQSGERVVFAKGARLVTDWPPWASPGSSSCAGAAPLCAGCESTARRCRARRTRLSVNCMVMP